MPNPKRFQTRVIVRRAGKNGDLSEYDVLQSEFRRVHPFRAAFAVSKVFGELRDVRYTGPGTIVVKSSGEFRGVRHADVGTIVKMQEWPMEFQRGYPSGVLGVANKMPEWTTAAEIAASASVQGTPAFTYTADGVVTITAPHDIHVDTPYKAWSTRLKKRRLLELATEISRAELVTVAEQAICAAAVETMDVMGYNVVAETGWIVKVYADGRREQVKKIAHND